MFNFFIKWNLSTKVTCKEGGCGACIINAQIFDYVSQKNKNISINSVNNALKCGQIIP